MADRSERREELKLVIEYVKLFISVAGIISLIFVGLQWQNSNRLAQSDVAQKMYDSWGAYLNVLMRSPELWPYFESGKILATDDPNRARVFALADMKLYLMDFIQRQREVQLGDPVNSSWERTFIRGFQSSPVMCERLGDTHAHSSITFGFARKACGQYLN